MIRHPNRRTKKKKEEEDKVDTAELFLKLDREREEQKELRDLTRRLEHELDRIKVSKGLI